MIAAAAAVNRAPAADWRRRARQPARRESGWQGRRWSDYHAPMLGVLGIAVLLFYAIGLPVALVLIFDLRRRLRELERQRSAVAVLPAAPVAPPPPVAPPALRPAAARPGLEAVIGGRWLTWVGILAIFFGTAFFVAMDLRDSPLSGVFQVLSGLVVALLFVLGGRALVPRRERVLGLGLLGGGIALLYLVAYGAFGFHRLVAPAMVYVFLVGVAVIGALFALRLHSATIAGLTLAGALLAPLLLSPPGDPAGALFPYLVAVNLGGVLVGRRAGWAGLPLAAFAGGAVLLAAWAEAHYGLDRRAATFAVVAVLWFLHAVTPLVGQPARGFWSAARGAVTLVNALLFTLVVWWLLAPDRTHLRGLALAVLALVYVGGARLGERRLAPGPGLAFTRVAGVAIAALAIPAQLDHAWVTFGWTALAAALLWTDLHGGGRTYRLLGLGVLVIAVVKAALVDPADAASRLDGWDPVTHGGFVAGLGVVGLLVGFSELYRRRGAPGVGTGLLVAAVVLLLVKITVEVLLAYAARSAALRIEVEPAAQLAVTLAWSVYILVVMLGGFTLRRRALRTLAIVLVALLVGKVFVFDLQVLTGGYRVAAFGGAGLVLLAISVLYQRRRGES